MSTNNENYNEDELVPPEWLNKDFLCEVLRNYEKDNSISIKNVEFAPATKQGDHYASIMFRAKVKYDQKNSEKVKSLIIKTMPEVEGQKKELLGESFLFQTEINMYTEILPKYEKLLTGLGDETHFGANCVYQSLNPRQVIIFEDLVEQGYTVIRNRSLTFEEIKAACLKLAKLHAISYKKLSENPAIYDKYSEGLLNMKSFTETDAFKGGITFFIETLEQVPTLAKYIPLFVPLEKSILSKSICSFAEYKENRKLNALYVLCHGDFHRKNMMFKHNPKTGKFEDLLLLDYQLSYVGPMVNDLIYGTFMLLDAEHRAKHYDEIREYYFTNFLRILKKIGFKGEYPKIEQFQAQFKEHKHFELYLMVTFLPMWIAMCSGEASPNDMLGNPEFQKKLYTNEKYIAELHDLIPHFIAKGYFEEV